MQTSISERTVVIAPNNRELIEAVIKAACEFYGITKSELLNNTKMANARHLCFYIIANSAYGVYDYDIGSFFNKQRGAVRYGVDLISHHKTIYSQIIINLNGIATIANNFEKKYQWHIQHFNTKH